MSQELDQLLVETVQNPDTVPRYSWMTRLIRAISSSGGIGTVTSVQDSANGDLTWATRTTTPLPTVNAGTTANKLVRLDGTAKLPAVDGTQLTGVEKTANKDATGGYV